MQAWFIVLLRTVVLFFVAIGITKIVGNENLSKSSPFKVISYIFVSVITVLISLGLVPNIAFAFVALASWILLLLALDYLSLKSKKLHDFINGRETVLMKDGKVLENNLMQVKFTGDELLRELRSKNAFNLADVEFAVMETTGDVNVLLKSDKKPVTPHDLHQKVNPTSEPETVILDGNILDEGLKNIGLNREWLKVQLSSSGVSLDNVFIAQADSSGDLYIDLFMDSIDVPQAKVKELLYASIAKAQSDLLSFSLEVNNPEVKKAYFNNANRLKKVMDKLEPYLMR